MEKLIKILDELNSLSEEDTKKLNALYPQMKDLYKGEPVDSMKQSIHELINQKSYDEYKKNSTDKINKSIILQSLIFSSPEYFNMLYEACKKKSACIDLCNPDVHSDLYNKNLTDMDYLLYFYHGIREYCAKKHIQGYAGDDCTDTIYHVSHGGRILSIGNYRYSSGAQCYITYKYILDLDSEQSINLDSILNYFAGLREKEEYQSVLKQ